MERKNNAYLSEEAVPESFTPFDNSSRGIEYFKTIDTLLVKHMFSFMEGKLKSIIYCRNVFFLLSSLSMEWHSDEGKIWNF